MGERGASSVKANCSPIDWNDSVELREVRVFFFFFSFSCRGLKHSQDQVEIPCFYTTERLFSRLLRSSLS